MSFLNEANRGAGQGQDNQPFEPMRVENRELSTIGDVHKLIEAKKHIGRVQKINRNRQGMGVDYELDLEANALASLGIL